MNPSELAEFKSEISNTTPLTVSLTVCMATIAAFSKSFVPFQFFGSAAIFTIALLLTMLGVLLDWSVYWRRLRALKGLVFWVAALFGFAAINFFTQSSNAVPATYLIGMVGLLPLFLLLGIVASFAFRLILIILFSMAIIYLGYCVIFLMENGSFYPDGYFGDVFELGRYWGGAASYEQLYQNVGNFLALGTLSLLYLSTSWTGKIRIWAVTVFGSVCFGIILASQARGALLGLLVALSISFKFRQIRFVIIFAVGAAIVATLTVGSFIDSFEQLPIWQRTVNEVLQPKQNTRLFIANFALRTLFRDPHLLWFGRGLGMFPVDFGEKPPNWLLSSNSVSVYPHNSVLEALYELGAVGALLVIIVLVAPILMASRLRGGIDRCRSALSFYFFFLAIEMVSGSLAYSYPFYFIYGVMLGRIASLRDEDRQVLAVAQFRGGSSS
jgi:hypothetical protein